MCKAGRIILMSAGIVMMCVILAVFGFVETGIPRMGYLVMWMICAGAIYYGAGAGNTLKKKDSQTEK